MENEELLNKIMAYFLETFENLAVITSNILKEIFRIPFPTNYKVSNNFYY